MYEDKTLTTKFAKELAVDDQIVNVGKVITVTITTHGFRVIQVKSLGWDSVTRYPIFLFRSFLSQDTDPFLVVEES
jgi:hypothetical protein